MGATLATTDLKEDRLFLLVDEDVDVLLLATSFADVLVLEGVGKLEDVKTSEEEDFVGALEGFALFFEEDFVGALEEEAAELEEEDALT